MWPWRIVWRSPTTIYLSDELRFSLTKRPDPGGAFVFSVLNPNPPALRSHNASPSIPLQAPAPLQIARKMFVLRIRTVAESAKFRSNPCYAQRTLSYCQDSYVQRLKVVTIDFGTRKHSLQLHYTTISMQAKRKWAEDTWSQPMPSSSVRLLHTKTGVA
jgi:hypothetical protein